MNWIEIIKEIQGYGLTQTDIAVRTGATQGHISDLSTGKRGKRIGFQLGGSILALRDQLRAGRPLSSADSSDSP